MKFLVTFKDRNKRIECDNPLELIDKIKSTYQLGASSIELDVFDNDFNEYVELEDLASLENMSKIRVRLKENADIENNDIRTSKTENTNEKTENEEAKNLVLNSLVELLKKASVNTSNDGDEDDDEDDKINRRHNNTTCDVCQRKNFTLDRYKCLLCDDYDLCGICFEQRNVSGTHSLKHAMIRFTGPSEIFAGNVNINENINKIDYVKLKNVFTDLVHDGICCNGCGSDPIVGLRLKCDTCTDCDMCEKCYENETESHDHSSDHPLLVCYNSVIKPSNIKLLNELGSGGFGKVYRAKLISNNKIVACKIIKYNPTMQLYGKSLEVFVESFLREITAYNELNSNYIIKIYGYCLEKIGEEVKCYLVMEFMEKGSLADVIFKESNKISLRCKFQMACNIASGMHRIHGHNFIHRDIRPDNILVTDDYTAKIADMGISKIVVNNETNTMVGCLRYMPKEFYTGKYDQKLDIFTFGLTLYELFTGLRHSFVNNKINLTEKSPIFHELIEQCIDEDQDKRPTAKYINDTLHLFYKVILKVIANRKDYASMNTENKNKLFLKIYNFTKLELQEIHQEQSEV